LIPSDDVVYTPLKEEETSCHKYWFWRKDMTLRMRGCSFSLQEQKESHGHHNHPSIHSIPHQESTLTNTGDSNSSPGRARL
jgi:hypothetical protein